MKRLIIKQSDRTIRQCLNQPNQNNIKKCTEEGAFFLHNTLKEEV
jgi:hypothetical protein